MAEHSVAARQSGAKTSARGPSLVAGADAGLVVREIGVFSTVAIASRVELVRISALGTGGAGLTEANWDLNSKPHAAAAANSPTADHTVTAGAFRSVSLPDAIGSGFIWTFGPRGLVIPEGASNGVALILPGGVDQIIDFYFDWDE